MPVPQNQPLLGTGEGLRLLENLLNGIDRFSSGLEVGSRQEFAHKAQPDQLHSRYEKDSSHQDERAVRNGEVSTKQELFEQKSEGDEEASSDADQTHETKKMKGPRYVMNQELDGNQVE